MNILRVSKQGWVQYLDLLIQMIIVDDFTNTFRAEKKEIQAVLKTATGLLIVFSEVCRSLCRRMPQENCPKL